MQGLHALGAAPWPDALGFLLTSAPLSDEDCELWRDLLPLVSSLVDRELPPPVLHRLAAAFAGGSALGWLEQQQQEGGAEWGHTQAALLPDVMHTVDLLAQRSQQCSSAGERRQLLDAMRASDWLALLCRLIERGGGSYAGRLAALRLAATLVDAQGERGAAVPADGLVPAVLRRVLMPRDEWDDACCCGSAAVLASLQLLLSITRAAPEADWAAAWAAVGSTYWLRASRHCRVDVREAAFSLLAAATAAPATHGLLCSAWPLCGEVAVAVAVDEAQPAAVRAGALATVAAALSHGPLSSSQQAALVQLPSLAAEALLQNEGLWQAVNSILHEASDGVGAPAAAASFHGIHSPCRALPPPPSLPYRAVPRLLPCWLRLRTRRCSGRCWTWRARAWTAQRWFACSACQPPSQLRAPCSSRAVTWPCSLSRRRACSMRPMLPQQLLAWSSQPHSWRQRRHGLS